MIKSIVYLKRIEEYDKNKIKESINYFIKETNVLENISKDSTIFIKLNLVGPFNPNMGITTHPMVLDCVLDVIEKTNCNIIIGDNPAIRDQIFTMKKCGIYEIYENHKKNYDKLSILENTKLITITNPNPVTYSDFDVSSDMVNSDLIINLPKVKTHTLAYITCAQKNFFGLIYGLNKSAWHAKANNPDAFGKAFNDLFGAYLNALGNKKILSIGDGIVGLEGDGPSTGGQKVKGNILLASLDAIALDRIALEVMKLDYNKAYMMQMASSRGYGNDDLNNIEIQGNTLEDFNDIKFMPPKDALSSVGLKFLKVKLVRNILLEHPKIDKDRCIKCGSCKTICPPKAMRIEKGKYPHLKSIYCIRCWCCAEVCPENAIAKTKRPLIGKIVLKK